MMNGRTLALILTAVFFSVVGQLLLKAGTRKLAGVDGTAYLWEAFRDLHVLSGLVAWTASTISWLYALKLAPLSRAYGLTSLTYVLIPLGSMVFFEEEVRRLHGVGTVLILLGVLCLVAGD